MEIKSSWETSKIIRQGSFPDSLFIVWPREKVLTSAKYGLVGTPNLVYSKEIALTFKMRGQPYLSYTWLKSYVSLNMIRNIVEKAVEFWILCILHEILLDHPVL